MNERDLFLSALEIEDSAARKAHLKSACADDADLLIRVESLLASHEGESRFLQTPVVEQLDDPTGQTAATIVMGTGSTQDEEPQGDDSAASILDFSQLQERVKMADEIPLGYLEPSTKPGSLGRLAHYEILEVVGQGAFGTVLRAFDEKLQRVVAIKVMAPELAATSPARKRFIREAQASAAIRHEHVVSVYSVEEKPIPYLVMEYIPGVTLQQRLDERGPLDVPTVLRLGVQIAEGLAAAHAKDLIHRDIKPGNILLETGIRDRVKITDFGLARAADDASMTQSGMIAGTPMYMAPEQALGKKLDQRADLFSFGSVLYQMASGRPPFRASSTLAVLKRLTEDTPRPIREIIPETPTWLGDIIAKLHAKNPDERYQSAREVADVLANCESQLKEHSRLKDLSLIPRAKTQPAGWWKWVAVAAVLLLPVIALAMTEFAGVTHLFRQQATPDPMKPGNDPAPPIQGAKKQTPDDDGWVQLFNGQDLSGWKKHAKAPAPWTVENGILKGGSSKGFLFSERGDYQNFHLRVEAKVNAGGNSNITFRAPFDAGKVGRNLEFYGVPHCYIAYVHKCVQLRDRPTPSIARAGPYASYPSALFIVQDDTLIRPDEWFTLELIADGNRFITKIDGKEAANCTDPLSAYGKGHIALGVSSDQTAVQYRKIEIKELPPVPPAKQEPLPPTYTNSIGMEFVIVPKGKSWLGGGKDKLGDQEVEIPADFYLGKYEVTQEEWEKVMEENPSHFSRTGRGSDEVKDISDRDLKRFPVETVSWHRCQIFVAKLNQREKETGWVYRLPTQVEWEYACRGGPMADRADSAFDFYFAKPTNTLLPEQANIYGKGLKRTCKVGSYEAYVLGLYDVYGNVREWCADTHQAPDASHRVNRGGGWDFGSVDCRTADRRSDPPSWVAANLGLRLARVSAGAPSTVAKTPPLAVAPFDTAQAKAHQTAWAEHLGVPVEYENSIGMKFRLIPPGEFVMGSTPGEIEAALKVHDKFPQRIRKHIQSEAPQHKVILTQPVYVASTEVTQTQYEQVMGTNPSHFSTAGEGKKAVAGLETGNHPVETVSWNDAAEFCARLSQQEKLKPFYFRSGETVTALEGRGYRLPTEAEWVHACQAGTTTRLSSGELDSVLVQAGWLTDNSGGRTHAVGSLMANPFGLYDMYGNVWEWVQDGWDPAFYAKFEESAAIDPSSPISAGDERIFRGKCANNYASWAHGGSLFRAVDGFAARSDGIGFRIVLPVDVVKQRWSVQAAATSKATVPTPLPATFTNSIGMEFVIVPKGKSWLGGGKDRPGDKEVEISADFYLGKYEVTQEEWEKVMGENPSHFSRTGDGKDAVKDIPDADLKRFPVEQVSWDQCQLFVTKLNKLENETGWVYRLPTEAEWEYACRGGPMADKLDSAFDYYLAKPTNTLLPEQANFGKDMGLNRTCKVGSYEANRLGLFDLHGNVWEWCDDLFDPNDQATVRGGSWVDVYLGCWAAHRGIAQTPRGHNHGFRLARVPSGAPSPAAKTPPLAVAPFTNADVQRIAALPAAEQVEEVRKELMKRNPGFDGTVTHKIENDVVTELRVVTDQVTDIAPIRVFNSLQVLDLSGTATNYHGNSQLADLSPLKGMNLAGLTYLDLNWTQVGNAGLAHFQDCKNLWFLGLDSTQVTDAGLANFKDCTRLTYLSLSRTKVGDAGLAHFQDCKQLTHLRLGGTQVSDAGLAYFKDCKSLRSLYVNSTLVSNAGLAPFEGCKELTMLHLQSTRVSDAGLAHFKDCKKLTRLVIALTKVTDLSLIKEMPLKELDCDFRPERDAEILRSIKTLEKINGKPAAEFWERNDKGEFKE